MNFLLKIASSQSLLAMTMTHSPTMPSSFEKRSYDWLTAWSIALIPSVIAFRGDLLPTSVLMFGLYLVPVFIVLGLIYLFTYKTKAILPRMPVLRCLIRGVQASLNLALSYFYLIWALLLWGFLSVE